MALAYYCGEKLGKGNKAVEVGGCGVEFGIHGDPGECGNSVLGVGLRGKASDGGGAVVMPTMSPHLPRMELWTRQGEK